MGLYKFPIIISRQLDKLGVVLVYIMSQQVIVGLILVFIVHIVLKGWNLAQMMYQ